MAKPGYGYAHQQERELAIAVMVDGTPCPFCRKPMTKRMSLDYDHVIPTALGGVDGPKRLSHASCNRSSGGKLGNRIRRARFTNSPKVFLDGRRKNATIRPARRLPKW